MPVLVNLRNYLADLKRDEFAKPENRRKEVPTITDLAKEVGINRVTLQNIAGNNVKMLNLEIADKIIYAIRQRGFSMEISDLLVYREPGNHKPETES